MDLISKAFGAFIKKPTVENLKIEKKEFLYCLIHVPQKDFASMDDFNSFLGNVFEAIEKTNGDVNQFMGGVVLALYGLPLPDDKKYENIKNIISFLINQKSPFRAIINETEGYAGQFGYEKRIEATVLSESLSADISIIFELQKNIIHIKKPLRNKMGAISESDKIIISG